MPSFVHPPAESLRLEHILSALADPVRLGVVRALRDAPEEALNCTVATAGLAHVPKSTMSHHFRILRESGLVETSKRGVENLNRLRLVDIETRFPGLLPRILDLAKMDGR